MYQAVANYLQLHTGDGEGQYYPFDVTDFLKKFNLSSHTVLSSLKILEQEGWLAFNEQVFIPAFVNFTVHKDRLYLFEQSHAHLEPLIKTLLRAYEGIFDQPTGISEKVLAGLLYLDFEKVKSQLAELNNAGIINYQPQKDTPQVYYLRRRIKAGDITIDKAAFELRKAQFLARIKQMLSFVNDTQECRSRTIGLYFGDENMRACGLCDNCLRKKNTELSKEEFDALHQRILAIIKNESLHSNDLLEKLKGTKKEKAWKVIEFLQAENKLEVDHKGWVSMVSDKS